MLCCNTILLKATSLIVGICFRPSSFLTLYQIDSHSLGRTEQQSEVLTTLVDMTLSRYSSREDNSNGVYTHQSLPVLLCQMTVLLKVPEILLHHIRNVRPLPLSPAAFKLCKTVQGRRDLERSRCALVGSTTILRSLGVFAKHMVHRFTVRSRRGYLRITECSAGTGENYPDTTCPSFLVSVSAPFLNVTCESSKSIVLRAC